MAAIDTGIVTLGDVPAATAIDLAVAAERAGVGTLWVSDEPYYRGAVPLATACAAATTRLGIGIGVVNPLEHPPVALARDFATFQEIAAGRGILGLGAGWQPPIEAQGLAFGRPLATVREAITILRALLANESVSHDGSAFRVTDVRLSFEATHPSRIFVASMFPRSLEQAGELADGVILSILCPVEYTAAARRLLDTGAGRVGREPAEVTVVDYILFHCDPDPDVAMATMKAELARFIQHSYDPEPAHWAKVAELGGFELDEFARTSARLAAGHSPQDAVEDAFVERFAIAGDATTCLDRLAAFADAGMDQAGLLFCLGIDPVQQVERVGDLVPNLPPRRASRGPLSKGATP